jgi:hypothetical protein
MFNTNIFFGVMMATNSILAICNLIGLYKSLNPVVVTPPSSAEHELVNAILQDQ